MRLVTALMILSLPVVVAAAGPGFDGLEDIGPDCTVVGSRLMDGVTVTISSEGGFDMLARTYNDSGCFAFNGADLEVNAPLFPENVSGTRFMSTHVPGCWFPDIEPIIFEFDRPIMLFGLSTLDLCESGDESAEVSLVAYDSLSNAVDVHRRDGEQGQSGLDLDWCVTGTAIVRVELTGTISDD